MPISKISSTVTFRKDAEKYVVDVDTDIQSIVRAINLGFRPMNLTSTERDALTDLFLGKIIYNTTTNKLNVYTGSWEEITSS